MIGDQDSEKKVEELYQTIKQVPFVSYVSSRARKMIFDYFISVTLPSKTTSIVDVGVTCDETYPESNMLEYYYPNKKQITCVGIGDASHLERRYPGMRFKQVVPHHPLPFADKSFDIAYSNAVLEHVGTRAQQKMFVHELCRVGKQVFIIVPNRLFLFEHHTALPIIHYFPNACFRAVAKVLGLKYWAKEENLNLFYPWEIAEFFPQNMRPKLKFLGIGLGIFSSNICIFSRRLETEKE